MSRKYIAAIFSFIAVLAFPAITLAHVIVIPGKVGIGTIQTYSISVPAEKDVPTVGLRLIVPDGIKELTPTVKAGWDIQTKKSGDDVSEIDWTNGSIPSGQRDDFTFSAQAPAKATDIQWKAYQTYSDGSVVSWDQTPAGSDDARGDKGPYSVTKVVNDLDASPAGSPTSTTPFGAYILSILAFIMAAAALVIKRSPKK